MLIESAKRTVKIPVIASVNCMSSDEWVSFSGNIEKGGADEIELNVFFLPAQKELSALKIENLYYQLVIKIREVTHIPLAVKMGSQFTNLPSIVNNLYVRGARGVVLFNRFYEPDIDIDKMQITGSEVLSTPADIRHRCAGLALFLIKLRRSICGINRCSRW
jgi:dihydroorotate dehydrogenase (fumarate)